MPDLARERCQACTGEVAALSTEETSGLHRELDGSWELEPDRLRRDFAFRNFGDAFAFASQVALLAEHENHHPSLTVGWGTCSVELTTHAARGLTRNDFVLAAKIDRMVGRRLIRD